MARTLRSKRTEALGALEELVLDEEFEAPTRNSRVPAGSGEHAAVVVPPLSMHDTGPSFSDRSQPRLRDAATIDEEFYGSNEEYDTSEWMNDVEPDSYWDAVRSTQRLSEEPAGPMIREGDRPDAEWLTMGETVGERYRVGRLLGLGGMGLVVEAVDLRDGQIVALKFLRPSLCLSGEIQKRFTREMRTMGKLTSEHALRVGESGQYRGVPFIAMEYLRGETTANRLRHVGQLDMGQAVGWVLQACEALAEAHRLGIVHRDLKPENLFLQRLEGDREIVKVLDFGISKTPAERNNVSDVVTLTHVVMGSPYYMPPEQLVASKDVDERSDVWSLGVTLFELLTGALPFEGDDVKEIAIEIARSPKVSLRSLRPDLPSGLELVIQRCLERERLNRYQSVAELARDLSQFGGNGCDSLVARICDTLGLEVGKWENSPVSTGKHTDAGALFMNNRFKALLPLGEGGSAKVTLAVTRGRFKKLLVLKSLLPSLAGEADFVRMFVAEAKLSSRLNHPNVIQVNDVFADNGLPTLVMEYLEGQPLSAILRFALAELPLELHLWMLCEVLAGLDYAHELKDYDGSALNLVHRDISPQNVFVTYDGQVKVLDFGIAKANGLAGHTRTGIVKGKVRYMSPEQIRGETLDRRVDVFAVGVMLWEAVTRQRLWRGLSEPEVMRRIAKGQIQLPTDVAPGCPPELVRICMKALAYDRNERYQTAAELRHELEEFLSERSATVAAKRAALFMSKHFGAECARMRQRVQKLLIEQRDESLRLAPPAQAQRAPAPRAPSRTTSSKLYRTVASRLDNISPITTLICGAAIATLGTWMLMSAGSPRDNAPAEQPARARVGK